MSDLHVRAQLAPLPTPVPPLRSSAAALPQLPRRSTEGHPLCQSLHCSTMYACCLQRDQQLSQLLALLLPWNPALRCRCAQRRPSQAEEHSRLCLRPVMDNIPGHRVLVSVQRHVSAHRIHCRTGSPRCAHQRSPHLGRRDGPQTPALVANQPLTASSADDICTLTSN